MLTQEVERLNNILKEKMAENDRLIRENDRLGRENGQLMNELQNWKAKEPYIISLEEKNNQLNNALDAKNAELQNKNNEIDDLK